MKNKTKNRLMIGCTVLLGVIGSTVGPLAAAASAASPKVVGVQTYGSTYGELSARWWQWAFSIPQAINPISDSSGANCAQGQVDDVWFLAGSWGGLPVTRWCSIPAGKPIFFPLINNVAFKPAGSETLLSLRQLAAGFVDSVTKLTCKIDYVDCADQWSSFRVRSPSFSVIAPPKGMVPPGNLSVPGNTDPLVSDGYWLLLSPLAPGVHVLHFGAETSGGFTVDVTYNLTIAP